MSQAPAPPKAFKRFTARYPKLAQSWELMTEAGAEGPLDERTQRLVKFAVAVGAMREGNVHAAVRKGLAAGLTVDEFEQCIALASSTLGMPSTVAVYSWMRDEIDKA